MPAPAWLLFSLVALSLCPAVSPGSAIHLAHDMPQSLARLSPQSHRSFWKGHSRGASGTMSNLASVCVDTGLKTQRWGRVRRGPGSTVQRGWCTTAGALPSTQPWLSARELLHTFMLCFVERRLVKLDSNPGD